MNDFRLDDFLPYLLNNAAESTSRAFSEHYRRAYGLTRAQWRIMAHLGTFGALTASEICTRGFLEKSRFPVRWRGWKKPVCCAASLHP